MDNTTSCRNFIFDSSPSNSLCSYISDDATSLITSGDFSNVSYFINNANDITLQFNELDLKRNSDDTTCSTDTSQNSTAKRTLTHNDITKNTTIVGRNEKKISDNIATSPTDQINETHNISTANRTFEKPYTANSTFNKKLDDTFEEISGKIAHTNFLVPHDVDKYERLNCKLF